MAIGAGFLAGTGTLMLAGAVAVGGMVYDAGAVRVQVDERHARGHHIHLVVPAAVLPTALSFVPDHCLRDASKEVRPWLPAIKVAMEELAKYPDVTLVEVDDAQDHVRIAKRGNAISIEVNAPDETVHVSVPLHTINAAMQRIASVNPDV